MTKKSRDQLTVASWPGRGGAHNPFLNILLDGLELAGCQVESLGTVEEVEKATPDILLLHWAERVFAESSSRGQILTKIQRLLRATGRVSPGTKVVWLVHNLVPHDARLFQKLVWPTYVRMLARRVDGFLTLAPGTVDQVRAALPTLTGKPGLGLWHPSYPGSKLSPEERAASRAALGFSANEFVLGYCGQIRPYKGVEELLKTFRNTENQALRLLLAGKPQQDRPGSDAFLGRLEREAGADPRVTLCFGNLAASTFRENLGACDVIVAPFKGYLHSGSIVHSLSSARPVLTPATPFSRSYEGLLGADWVRLYDGNLTPALLERQGAGPVDPPDLSLISQASVGQAAVKFFSGLMSRQAQAN